MFEIIRNKYLYNKTQIVELDKNGLVVASDDLIFKIKNEVSITEVHPFFEVIASLIGVENEEITFNCVHLDFADFNKTVDILFNSGTDINKPFLIIFDFTEHYNTFQSIAQEKNESILNFHLAELKTQQLESEKKFKNKFLANVSHDLKTPIGASLWFIGMLEKSQITDQQKELVQLIKETSSHIKALVDDILDLSKIELGEMKLHNGVFDFVEMIHHIEKIITPKASSKNLSFSVVFESKFEKNYIGDKIRIIQIIINLLDNAIKFTKKGTVILTLSSRKSEKNNSDNIQIKVADTGTGIKYIEKNEVFESFKKLHNSKKIEGSGLGLSIISNLVEMMEGTIDFESEIGKGTTFTVEIPLKLSHQIAKKPDAYVKKEIDKKIKVLIIEDDDINQLLLMKLLINHKGFIIETANNGLQALELIENQVFDLILIDKIMPVLDGYKTTESIRKNSNPKISSLPIIGISGFNEKTQDEIELLGFNDFVSKPINKEELFSKIYKLLKI